MIGLEGRDWVNLLLHWIARRLNIEKNVIGDNNFGRLSIIIYIYIYIGPDSKFRVDWQKSV